MSKIKNTNQKVNTLTYTANFVNIFGEHSNQIPTTGMYRYDKKSGVLFMVDSNIPKSIKNDMESKTEKIRHMKPIKISKKGKSNAH